MNGSLRTGLSKHKIDLGNSPSRRDAPGLAPQPSPGYISRLFLAIKKKSAFDSQLSREKIGVTPFLPFLPSRFVGGLSCGRVDHPMAFNSFDSVKVDIIGGNAIQTQALDNRHMKCVTGQ